MKTTLTVQLSQNSGAPTIEEGATAETLRDTLTRLVARAAPDADLVTLVVRIEHEGRTFEASRLVPRDLPAPIVEMELAMLVRSVEETLTELTAPPRVRVVSVRVDPASFKKGPAVTILEDGTAQLIVGPELEVVARQLFEGR